MTRNKKNDKQIADELNACFESILAGNDSVESCLTRYPRYSTELKPLLEIMQAARASSLSPDPSFRARARYEFRSALYDNIFLKYQPTFAWRWRWATIASTAGVFLLTSTGGVVAASSNSMPGQTLYQVKRTIENVQLTMTPSQAAKARLYATLADQRISELVYAAQMGDVKLTEDLTQQFTNNLNMVSVIASPSRALNPGSSSKQSGAPSVASSTPEQSTTTTNSANSANSAGTTNGTAVAMPPSTTGILPPAPTPTIIFASPPQVTVTQAAPVPTPTFMLPQPTITLSAITDPALLKLLQQYSVKNIAELMSILDKVSPSVKTALLAAIQAATSGYGQILGA